ncbi:MAG TPA: hypothetical protein ENN84_11620 [Candidatus Marinimicrobia bacterium]|nr:hypothetical protein [Candidatus Neomarinimicrobiota bacterium]
MKSSFLFLTLLIGPLLWGQDYFEEKINAPKSEFTFIGYYLMRGELNNFAPKNEFLKGQIVGRLFGTNSTRMIEGQSRFSEMRFIPIIAYTPRIFDGWASMRMSFEFDWTQGDANYGAGGNFGGAFGADFVNMQTQNLYLELHPATGLYINMGLARLFDNILVPAYTGTSTLINTGYRLAFWGSDASGLTTYYLRDRWRTKLGLYQLYENNVDQDDDVILTEFDYEYDFDHVHALGFSAWYLRDHANGEGGVSILGQGLNSALADYNGVYQFEFGNNDYKADVIWLGTHFHGNPLLDQGRFGYSGFAVLNTGSAWTDSVNVKIMGYALNTRLAYKYGRTTNDLLALDITYTSGDKDNIRDGEYNGVLTGNNWSAPGAVYFSHGLYLLLPHGNVVNRFTGAVMDIQNIGYGLFAQSFVASYDLIPHKLMAKTAVGYGLAPVAPFGGGHEIGTEVNFNLRYTPKVFFDIELHAAYLKLGDFYESAIVNGSDPNGVNIGIPKDPWTVFLTLKWIMF